MYRFYFEKADFNQKQLLISDMHEVHHMKDVLRLSKGSKVQVFNGSSQEADVVVCKINGDGVEVLVTAVRQQQKKAAKIVLACAPPKKGKFETIIEKATELGVDEIIPLQTKRSQVLFPKERMQGKLSRFNAVATNAAKQSKRLDIPKIHPMTSFNEVIKNLDPNGLHLIPSLLGHPQHIKDVLLAADKKVITIFIGPEGDFTADEVRLAQEAGAIAVSLGDTVLKVETAAMASVALVKFLI